MLSVTPLISVITSVYNEPISWLKISLDSILNQSFTNFEFILLNDNPLNLEVSEFLYNYSLKDERIILINNIKNIGLTKSLNIGLHLAKGDFIIRHDADDISIPNRFKIQYDFMISNPDISVCGSSMLNFSKSLKHTSLKIFPTSNYDIKRMFLFKNVISHPTVIIRNSCLKNNNIIYNENEYADYAEDIYLWFNILKVGLLHNLNIPLIYHRLSSQQITNSKSFISYRNAYFARKKYLYNFYVLEEDKDSNFIDYSRIMFETKNIFIRFIKLLFNSPSIFFNPLITYYVLKEKFYEN